MTEEERVKFQTTHSMLTQYLTSIVNEGSIYESNPKENFKVLNNELLIDTVLTISKPEKTHLIYLRSVADYRMRNKLGADKIIWAID